MSNRVAHCVDSAGNRGDASGVTGPIDEFCEGLRSQLHARGLKAQSELDLVRHALAELERARQTELVAPLTEQLGLPQPAKKPPSSSAAARSLLTAVQNLRELREIDHPIRSPNPAGLSPTPPSLPPSGSPNRGPDETTPWPALLEKGRSAPIVVVGGSSRPEKLNEALGPLAACVEWIETSRQGTHAIGNLSQRIRQRRVGALVILDAAVGHKHSEPVVSAAREVKIPTTYAHKGGVAALARAFTQLEKMVGAR